MRGAGDIVGADRGILASGSAGRDLASNPSLAISTPTPIGPRPRCRPAPPFLIRRPLQTFALSNTAINGWTFDIGASNYSFTNTRMLDFNGAGIVVNGGGATITNNRNVDFNNASTAGNASIINNVGLDFFNSARPDKATITNSVGGVMNFFNASTAGSATITNNDNLDFHDSSRGGNATTPTDPAILQYQHGRRRHHHQQRALRFPRHLHGRQRHHRQ